MASTRIYLIARKPADATEEPAAPRLVRAPHPSVALRHIAEDTYTVAVASQDDLEKHIGAGVKVEKAD